jgi:heme oxygenase
MSRRRHHKAERLPPKALELVESGLVNGLPYDLIAERVESETGEQISAAAIGRYYQAKVRPRQEATKQAQLVAHEMAQWMGDLSDGELRRAIALKAAKELHPMLQALAEKRPADLAFFYSSLEQRRLEEKKLEQRTQELELRAKKVEQERQILDAKLAEIRRKLEAAEKPGGRAATKDDLRRAIRELYGIVIAEPAKEATP